MNESPADHSASPKLPHRSAESDELRPVTALFADVVGSTGLGERLDPAEVKAVIGECVSRMCETVEAYGGEVTGQMGDGIAAFFGIRVAREDDALRAMRAAMEMRSVLARFAMEVREAWGVEALQVRIGINSGRVATGPVGGHDESLIALGDPVNVAARLQSAAAPGGIVIGASSADDLLGRLIVNDLGLLSVKGRSGAVQAYELVGIVEGTKRQRVTAFVGREREVEDVMASLTELASGRGQIVTVVGDGGIGKTRLLNELHSRAGDDVRWLEATCDPIDHRLPYEPVEHLLRSFLGIDPGASGVSVRARFRAVMAELFQDRFDDVAPQLARIMGLDLEDRLMRRLDGLPRDVLTRELHAAVGEWLAALARQSQVVVAVDNLHDASAPTAELLSDVVAQVERLPILFLMTTRRDPESPGWAVRIEAVANHSARCQDVALRALAPEASRTLVDSLDKAASLDQEMRDVIIERAEGNPLYIEQMVAAIRSRSDSWQDQLPRALESLLVARIDALSTGARRTLQAAAVVGRNFFEDVVSAMVGSEYEPAIDELLRSDVLRELERTPRQLGFRHGLLREAALSTLTPERLRVLHSDAAAALEGWPGYVIERDGVALARFLVVAGGSGRAAKCLEQLGDRLTLVYRTDEAREAYDRAIAALPGTATAEQFAELVLKQVEVLGTLGEAEPAIALIDEALSRRPSLSTSSRLTLAKARRLGEADRIEDVDALVGVLLASRPEPQIAAQALILRAWLALGRSDVRTARESADALSQLKPGPVGIELERASLEGGIAAHSGEFEDAAWAMRRAVSLAEESGKVPEQLLARRRLAVTLYLRGFITDAFEQLSEVYGEYKRLGFVLGQVETAVNLLTCALHHGELEAARIVAEEALALTAEPAWRAMILSNLGCAVIELGDLARARDISSKLAAMEQSAPPWVVSSRRFLNANVAYLDENWEEALAALVPPESDESDSEGPLLAFRAQLLQAMGSAETAYEYAKRAVALADSGEFISRVQIERIWGQIEALRNPATGRASLERCLEASRRSGMRPHEARCLLALGLLNDEHRDTYFAEAREIFERCGSKLGLIELERAEREAEQLSRV